MGKRVLFCTHSIDNGGSAKSLQILIKYLDSQYKPGILSLREPVENSSALKFYQKRKIPIFTFPFGWLPVSYVNCPINVEVQKKRIQEMRPYLAQLRWLGAAADYICFNGYASTSLAPHFDRHIPRVLIAREQLLDSAETAKVSQFLRANISRAIAIGPREAEQLQIMRIPHMTVFNSAETTPTLLPFPPHPPIKFSVFTRFGPDKGIDTLLEACKIFREQLASCSAVINIYGAGGVQKLNVENIAEKYIEEHGLSSLVKIMPWTDNVESAIRECHCIVRPDKSGSPWGRDIIEAMSLGRPVLATGDADIFVKQDATGWLVPPDDPFALGKKLAWIAQNPLLLEKAGENAFCFAKENFDPVVNTSRLADYLFAK